jgi:hypothetical protein
LPGSSVIGQALSFEEFNGRMRGIVQERDPALNTRLVLQPLDKVYLYSSLGMEEHEAEESSDMIVGSIHNLRILITVAEILWLIACANYANLSTVAAVSGPRRSG